MKTLMKKAALPLKEGLNPRITVSAVAAELQSLQRQRAVVIKSRIMQTNRLQAVLAGTMGYHSGMPEKDRLRKFKEATDLINAIMKGEANHPFDRIVRTTTIGIEAFEELQRQTEKEMLVQVKKLPVCAWVNHPDQRGFGLLFLAIVIGETGDLSNYPNPGKVWRRLGCAPWTFDGKTLMGATWKGGKEGKLPACEWEQFGYSPRRRSIAFLIGEGIVKQNGTGPYRTRYNKSKEQAHQQHPQWTDLRCHRHAMLLATKRLLRELWCAWRKQG